MFLIPVFLNSIKTNKNCLQFFGNTLSFYCIYIAYLCDSKYHEILYPIMTFVQYDFFDSTRKAFFFKRTSDYSDI